MEWGDRNVSNHVPADKLLMDEFGQEKSRFAKASTVCLQESQRGDGPGKSPVNGSRAAFGPTHLTG